MAARIIGVICTPDRYWRVEVVQERGQQWYRIWHARTCVEQRASIATVERILGPEAFAALEPAEVEPGAA